MSGILSQTEQASFKYPSKIGFFSPLAGVGVDCGYGYAAVQLILSWQRQGVPVWTADREAPVAFNFGQPHFYEQIRGALNIGYTPWESTKVPDSWVKEMNKMDEIWTTCEANAEWYRDGGIEVPVKVLHHGINRNHFPIKKRKIGEDGVFKFLHIGEPTPRKGGKLVYEVFCEEFADNPRVSLTLKGSPRFDVECENVIVIDEKLSQAEMTELYLNHHAMIYPTSGEGFGFIPFQAAMTGMPTAVTNWSGPLDYMEYCFPIRVDDLVMADYDPHEGLWAKPSKESVRDLMTSFVSNPSYYFHTCYMAAQQDSYWQWDNLGIGALKNMTKSLKTLPI